MDTNPENFRRDAGWPCVVCGAMVHSVEMLGIHYNAHTEEEKTAAWTRTHRAFEKTLQERRHVFALVPVGGWR
jgi:hypothetical protein